MAFKIYLEADAVLSVCDTYSAVVNVWLDLGARKDGLGDGEANLMGCINGMSEDANEHRSRMCYGVQASMNGTLFGL